MEIDSTVKSGDLFSFQCICLCAHAFGSINGRGSPCMADRERKVQLEQTSRADPDRPSQRRVGLAPRLQPAGIRSASPLLFHTCGTTAAHRSLCLEVFEYGNMVN